VFVTHLSAEVCRVDRRLLAGCELMVSAYSAAEIRSLHAGADREESEMLQFFLFTGAREQEVQYATWRDVDFDAKTFTVSEKLDLGYMPKDKEEGAIPIPDSLVKLLRARRLRFPNSRLIFTNTQGNPNGHFLRILKHFSIIFSALHYVTILFSRC
jgi:integrase/recombinase XerD